MSLLHEDILKPLANPIGENLRRSPVYQKIKEARSEDQDDAPKGKWEWEPKKADSITVIELTTDALVNKSKDLQLAAWLAEALIRQQGLSVVPECIKLIHNLQLQFWDTLYPPLEGASPEYRATPQESFAACCDRLLRKVPLTQKGYNWLEYMESRAVGYKAAPEEEDLKQKKKITAEDFDEAVEKTPRDFYVDFCSQLESSRQALAGLEDFCHEKYGDVAPSFLKLGNVLQDLQQTVNVFLRQKKEQKPKDAIEETRHASPGDQSVVDEAASRVPAPAILPSSQEPIAAAQSDKSPSITIPEGGLGSLENAATFVGSVAKDLRKLDPKSVVPYLLTRSLRWGELRSAAEDHDSPLLTAPSAETRQELTRLRKEHKWEEVLATAEAAVISPAGRAWLDVHRYAWEACNELSYSAVAKAICSELKALLADFPKLPDWKLDDDLHAANEETKVWIRKHVLGPAPKPETPISIQSPASPIQGELGGNGVTNIFETALQLAQKGSLAEAIHSLVHQNSRSDSGREKFVRRLQVSQLCMQTGQEAVAYPILQDLFSEIERRELLDWESTDFLVQPLTLLVQCIDRTNRDSQQRSQIYNLLCRLEPTVALQFQVA